MTLSRAFTCVAALLLLASAAVGCSSSSRTFAPYEATDIAQFTLPFDRDVPAHPDSLRQVRIVEGDRQLKIVTEESYQETVRNWSAQRRNDVERRRQRRANDYATFWGMDPSILSLQAETGVTGLTKDKARELIERRKAEVRTEIQIDVYWFTAPSAATGTTTAYLRVDDNTRYPSTRRDVSPLRDGFLPGGRNVLYRRITYFFDRERDGKDILEGTTSIELEVNRIATASNDSFTWNWEDVAEEAESTSSPAR
jgi:hypothetical protein